MISSVLCDIIGLFETRKSQKIQILRKKNVSYDNIKSLQKEGLTHSLENAVCKNHRGSNWTHPQTTPTASLLKVNLQIISQQACELVNIYFVAAIRISKSAIHECNIEAAILSENVGNYSRNHP